MKSLLLAIVCVFTITAQAAQELRVLQQKGVTGNMPMIYTAIPKFEQMARQQGLDVKVVLVPMSNANDATVSMLNGKIDIVQSALDPFLVANDRAPGRLKLLMATMDQGMDVICSNPDIQRPEDIKPHHRIAMKGIGSAEHRMIKQLSQRVYKDPTALDKSIVVMPRTQISTLMAAGSRNTIDCAVPGTPMQGTLVSAGYAKKIYTPESGNRHGAWASKEWLDKNPVLAGLWISSLKQAGQDIMLDPRSAFQKFREIDGVSMTVEEIVDSFKQSNQTFVMKLDGVAKHVAHLHSIGVLKTLPKLEDLVWRADLAQ